MGIETKTLGFLIDELITTDIKCFMAQEDLMDMTLSEGERLEAAVRTQQTNSRRNEIIRAIDSIMGLDSSTVTSKSYTKRHTS